MAKYADLNWKAHVRKENMNWIFFLSYNICLFQDESFQDGIEDLVLRLDEFEHLLTLTGSDSSKCLFKQMPKIVEKYEEMENVFDKIDK
jgi:hypothetical protein